MKLLDGKSIVLGVCGGIAAYKTCELARLLAKEGARLQPVLTRAGAELVGPRTFEALCGQPALVDRAESSSSALAHIELARSAHLILIAPTTANTLAKIACGLADNLLTSIVLASQAPVLLAPAMNVQMWKNEITQENVERLQRRERFHFIGPASGELACGAEGPGRMEEPEVILQAVLRLLGPGTLQGKRFLITAGPTREPIDAVRVLSNRSSGKMGYVLARAAVRRGAEVTLISGPVSLEPPWSVQIVRVETAEEMLRAVEDNLDGADVLIMSAAVADFTVKDVYRGKLKKSESVPRLELTPTKDILKTISQKRKKPFLVGFAAEFGDPLAEAQRKLKEKGLQLVVGNDISQPGSGFDADSNQAVLVEEGSFERLPLLSKAELAEKILDKVEKLLH